MPGTRTMALDYDVMSACLERCHLTYVGLRYWIKFIVVCINGIWIDIVFEIARSIRYVEAGICIMTVLNTTVLFIELFLHVKFYSSRFST